MAEVEYQHAQRGCTIVKNPANQNSISLLKRIFQVRPTTSYQSDYFRPIEFGTSPPRRTGRPDTFDVGNEDALAGALITKIQPISTAIDVTLAPPDVCRVNEAILGGAGSLDLAVGTSGHPTAADGDDPGIALLLAIGRPIPAATAVVSFGLDG